MKDVGGQLREARLEAGVGLDQLARLTGLTKGHLSRVERNLRPVTPSIALAYERALGVRMTAAHEAYRVRSADVPRHEEGEDDAMRRRDFLGSIMAIASGARPAPPTADAVDMLPNAPIPARIGLTEVAEIENATYALAAGDLRHGGCIAATQGTALLRWALRLLHQDPTPAVRVRLCSAAGYLADRTAWASFDVGQHDQAKHLFRVALQLATDAGEPNLIAQILCDAANQAIFLNRAGDALALSSVAEDNRDLAASMRAAVYAVKAEAYGAIGDVKATERYIGRAEDCFGDSADGQPAWLGSFRNQAGLFASTGYASLALARNGHDRAVPSTFTRLTAAADGLPEARARAAISCDAKLGALHLAHPSGDPAVGVARARHVLAGMRTVRSVRVLRDARHLRTALAGHPRDAEAKHLGHELDQLLDQVI